MKNQNDTLQTEMRPNNQIHNEKQKKKKDITKQKEVKQSTFVMKNQYELLHTKMRKSNFNLLDKTKIRY